MPDDNIKVFDCRINNGDVIKNYAGGLKEKGWKTDIIQMGDKGGSLNGQKGTMGTSFMFSYERKDGMWCLTGYKKVLWCEA